MSGFFGGLKNTIYQTGTSIISKVKGVNTKSTFFQDGKLIPDEFVDACDRLIYMCPSWKWQAVPDPSHRLKDLPDEKQYISTRISSKERAKDAMKNIEMTEVVRSL